MTIGCPDRVARKCAKSAAFVANVPGAALSDGRVLFPCVGAQAMHEASYTTYMPGATPEGLLCRNSGCLRAREQE